MNTRFAPFSLDTTGSLAVFFDDERACGQQVRALDDRLGGALTRALDVARFEGKEGQIVELIAPQGIKAARVLAVGTGKGADLERAQLERIGAAIANRLVSAETELAILVDLPASVREPADRAASALAVGAALGSYAFERYMTKASEKRLKKLQGFTVLVADVKAAETAHAGREGVIEGVYLARDLVNEPPNVLTPAVFAERAADLADLGVEIEVLGPADLEELKMLALLGVARGSVNEARLVAMRWNGGPKDAQPLALIGKGVTFDTGGISLKPGAGMDEMKGDMGGAAAVVGAMHAIARRKAQANVVGLIGLVENMPDGNAQRPGDIVTSMSGQTIEILNTDAEGRLVLADVVWYAQERFKPQAMVDLATLTGAILIALGHEHAGLFSDNDPLAEHILAAGKAAGEPVWRLPIGSAYDRAIDSKVADVKNIGNRSAGSIIGAQFIKRFTNGVPWAHLDIAGMAWLPERTAVYPSWGTGWGVRLLDTLVQQAYES